MQGFHHFIITRFNVNITQHEYAMRLVDTWLAIRLDLFQRYCFPTLRAQHNQDFTWLVLFDEQTPLLYRKMIEAYAKYENFVPVFCRDFDSLMPSTVAKMREIAPDVEWFLTTRLDSDDALATGFVGCLQGVVNGLDEAALKPSDTLYINFPSGLQRYEGAFYDFRDETNAFVSLLERADDPKTVFWVDHPSIHDVAPVIQAETDPLWLQVVHETNLYNYLRGEKAKEKDYSKIFPCDFTDG